MGLAASQARLLLLTARKSDLEYRAQCITNTEMILAMQTEAVARRYSERISNQALFYSKASGSSNQTTALYSGNIYSLTSGAFKLQVNIGVDESGNPQYEDYVKEDSKAYTYYVSSEDISYTDADGNEKKISAGGEIPEAVYQTLTSEQKLKCEEKYHDYNNNDINELELLTYLNTGAYRIVYADQVDENGEPIPVSLSANTGFVEAYYTDDDAEAEAEYKRETAAIQVKEKRLQMDLQQVESQQKACETEIDSVKKVIEKNIEKTFKVFS